MLFPKLKNKLILRLARAFKGLPRGGSHGVLLIFLLFFQGDVSWGGLEVSCAPEIGEIWLVRRCLGRLTSLYYHFPLYFIFICFFCQYLCSILGILMWPTIARAEMANIECSVF